MRGLAETGSYWLLDELEQEAVRRAQVWGDFETLQIRAAGMLGGHSSQGKV